MWQGHAWNLGGGIIGLALLSAGCGSGVDSGLDPEQEAGTLSPTEVVQLCEADRDHFEALVTQQMVCAIEGLSGYRAAIDQHPAVACEQARQDCLASSEWSWTCQGARMSSSCTKPVREVEACVGDWNAAYANFASSIPRCDEMGAFLAGEDQQTAIEENELYPFPPRPESCVAVGDECFYQP